MKGHGRYATATMEDVDAAQSQASVAKTRVAERVAEGPVQPLPCFRPTQYTRRCPLLPALLATLALGCPPGRQFLCNGRDAQHFDGCHAPIAGLLWVCRTRGMRQQTHSFDCHSDDNCSHVCGRSTHTHTIAAPLSSGCGRRSCFVVLVHIRGHRGVSFRKQAGVVHFEVYDEGGQVVLENGVLVLSPVAAHL